MSLVECLVLVQNIGSHVTKVYKWPQDLIFNQIKYLSFINTIRLSDSEPSNGKKLEKMELDCQVFYADNNLNVHRQLVLMPRSLPVISDS